jgi:hypothetical protein
MRKFQTSKVAAMVYRDCQSSVAESCPTAIGKHDWKLLASAWPVPRYQDAVQMNLHTAGRMAPTKTDGQRHRSY